MSGHIKRPFEAVFEEHFSYVYNIVYMHLLNRETAEDLTSDIFIKAYAAWPQYDPERAGERTWLSTIANRTLIDHYRSRAASRVFAVEDEVLNAIPSTDEALDKLCDSTNDAVRLLLAELDPQERHLLEMRYLMDMKNPEIGEVLGINAKAVSERLRRLTEKCRKIADQKNLRDWL